MFKNFKHKIIYLFIGLLVGSLFPIQSLFAEQPITLIINGKTITNALPQIVSDRTYVPLRVISEELGATVEWDGVNRVVRIIGKGNEILLDQNKPQEKPIINQQQSNDTFYKLNNLDVIKLNNIEYVSMVSISSKYYENGYSFSFNSNTKETAFIFNNSQGRSQDKNKILLKIPSVTIIQDRGCVEYNYFLNTILPLIKS